MLSRALGTKVFANSINAQMSRHFASKPKPKFVKNTKKDETKEDAATSKNEEIKLNAKERKPKEEEKPTVDSVMKKMKSKLPVKVKPVDIDTKPQSDDLTSSSSKKSETKSKFEEIPTKPSKVEDTKSKADAEEGEKPLSKTKPTVDSVMKKLINKTGSLKTKQVEIPNNNNKPEEFSKKTTSKSKTEEPKIEEPKKSKPTVETPKKPTVDSVMKKLIAKTESAKLVKVDTKTKSDSKVDKKAPNPIPKSAPKSTTTYTTSNKYTSSNKSSTSAPVKNSKIESKGVAKAEVVDKKASKPVVAEILEEEEEEFYEEEGLEEEFLGEEELVEEEEEDIPEAQIVNKNEKKDGKKPKKLVPNKRFVIEKQGEDQEEVVEEEYVPPANIAILDERSVSLREIVDCLKENDGQELSVISVKEKTTWMEYIITCTGKSSRHMRGLSENLVKMLKTKTDKKKNFYVEGKNSDQWQMLDCGSFIIQIFSAEARRHYDTERLWTYENWKPDDPELVLKPSDTLRLMEVDEEYLD